MTACCGGFHTITLSNDGTLYSFGRNEKGQLGLGHNNDVSLPTPIPNLPQISLISCGTNFTVCVDYEGFIWSFGENHCGPSCYLIDFEVHLWSFGKNGEGQLGHGDTNSINAPKVISALKDIQQISYGIGIHFLAKNSQNQIFVIGNNYWGQLGTGDTQSASIFKEINSRYSTIWGDVLHTRAKSARK